MILFLGPADSPIIPYLGCREEVLQTSGPVQAVHLKTDFIVSYGYRHILRKSVLDMFPSRAVNLHISYLPWNRGADPNLWSWVENTTKGVTIHYMDEGIDTGDIIAQKVVQMSDDETLASSYEKLQAEIQSLFKWNWPRIRAGTCPRRKQVAGGSAHRSAEKSALSELLAQGWSTPVSALAQALAHKGDDDGKN